MQKKLREAIAPLPNGCAITTALMPSTGKSEEPESNINAYVGINFFRPEQEGDTDIIEADGKRYNRTQLAITVEAAIGLRHVLNKILADPICTCGGTMIPIGPGRMPHTHYHCVECEREVPIED